mgnify:FL=1
MPKRKDGGAALTPKEKVLVDALSRGLSAAAAMSEAGYRRDVSHNQALQCQVVVRRPAVAAALRTLTLKATHGMSREELLDILAGWVRDAKAKLHDKIRAAHELALLEGWYSRDAGTGEAPETKGNRIFSEIWKVQRERTIRSMDELPEEVREMLDPPPGSDEYLPLAPPLLAEWRQKEEEDDGEA